MKKQIKIALDMLMVKKLVESKILQLRWVPTWKQLTDPLTKEMNTELVDQFQAKNLLCLVETKEVQCEELLRESDGEQWQQSNALFR